MALEEGTFGPLLQARPSLSYTARGAVGEAGKEESCHGNSSFCLSGVSVAFLPFLDNRTILFLFLVVKGNLSMCTYPW